MATINVKCIKDDPTDVLITALETWADVYFDCKKQQGYVINNSSYELKLSYIAHLINGCVEWEIIDKFNFGDKIYFDFAVTKEGEISIVDDLSVGLGDKWISMSYQNKCFNGFNWVKANLDLIPEQQL